MEEELVVDVAKKFAEAENDPQDGIMNGMVEGMNRARRKDCGYSSRRRGRYYCYVLINDNNYGANATSNRNY